MKRVYAKEDLCIGCRLCEIHCLVQHSRSKRIITAMLHEKDSVTPRVMVEQSGQVTFALQCRHCRQPRCMEACMTGAITRDPASGAILHDAERCVGCWMCIMTCPVGAIHRGRQGHVASKCDLCLSPGEGGKEPSPACVANCPNEALVFEEREDADADGCPSKCRPAEAEETAAGGASKESAKVGGPNRKEGSK